MFSLFSVHRPLCVAFNVNSSRILRRSTIIRSWTEAESTRARQKTKAKKRREKLPVWHRSFFGGKYFLSHDSRLLLGGNASSERRKLFPPKLKLCFPPFRMNNYIFSASESRKLLARRYCSIHFCAIRSLLVSLSIKFESKINYGRINIQCSRGTACSPLNNQSQAAWHRRTPGKKCN